ATRRRDALRRPQLRSSIWKTRILLTKAPRSGARTLWSGDYTGGTATKRHTNHKNKFWPDVLPFARLPLRNLHQSMPDDEHGRKQKTLRQEQSRAEGHVLSKGKRCTSL